MSNVDYAEIAKFEALAHRWWDRESEFKPLHDINPLRVNWIDERVNLAGKGPRRRLRRRHPQRSHGPARRDRHGDRHG